MAESDPLTFSLEGFSGHVRLFPLPNLVLFPHVMQPLHVFEPRYRNLLEDSLADDRLIAIALLKPGWELEYEGRPPVHAYACLGRVATHHRLDDGTYNLLLLGLRRVRLVRELEPVRSYREAEVVVCNDESPDDEAAARAALQRRLRETLLETLPAMPEARDQLDQLLGGRVSLGALTDLIAYMLEIDLPDKMALLSEQNVRRRAETILRHLRTAAAAPKAHGAFDPFPPLFSSN